MIRIAVAFALLAGAAPAHAARVHDVRQISRDTLPAAVPGERDTQAEPSIALDPQDPRTLVSVFQVRRFRDGAAAAIGYASSRDGGATWIRGILPGLTRASGGRFRRASDPVVTFGADGAAYALSLLVDPSRRDCAPARRTAVAVQRSADGGRTYGPPVLAQDDRAGCDGPFNDKPWIAADTQAGSPFRGRLYLVWTQLPGRLVERHSDDGGAHWSALRAIPFRGDATGAIPVVGPGGRLTVVFDDYTPRCCPTLRAIGSPDGGISWGPARRIARMRSGGPPRIRFGPAEGFPAAAVDPADGTLHVAWQDVRFRRRLRTGIVVSRSRDGGRRWSEPRAIGARRRTHQLVPAIGAHGGDVAVTYLTVRGGSHAARQRVALSHDGGSTFGRSLRLGPRMDLRRAARVCEHCESSRPRWARFLGDYACIAAGPGVAHPVWPLASAARGRGHHQTTWSAAVRWPARADVERAWLGSVRRHVLPEQRSPSR